ncbi:hypothetical protein SELMODRAFT_412042 [Selaginella moellendorffii]|uniref:Uncharacterized protein n=1 Tax=Selaginella moellendorffii TaxID=88036 RepID=D8RJV2_SELML|nr:hypothetical protein SELMODRAFT_412042 [Selaginella moellendorffii]
MLHALLVNNRSRLNLIPKYMYNPAVALRDTVIELEVAIEGGKDSLSMAVQAGGETVKALANLVISHWRGSCSFVGTGKGRLGGFALAQSFDQLPLCGLVILAWTLKYLKRAFNATQGCMKNWAFQAFYTIQKGIILFNQKPCMSIDFLVKAKKWRKFLKRLPDRDSGIMHLAFELVEKVARNNFQHITETKNTIFTDCEWHSCVHKKTSLVTISASTLSLFCVFAPW